MPVQYPPGILEEHRTVREAVGLFDVLHMGEVFFIEGAGAARAVQRVVTKRRRQAPRREAMYGPARCARTRHRRRTGIVYRLAAARS